MKKRFLKKNVLNTIRWTLTVIAVCMLLMSEIEWRKIATVYIVVNMIFMYFDREFHELNGFI